jgi:hypothetical protein
MPLFLSEVFLFRFSVSVCTKVEPMSEGFDSVPLLMASLLGAKAFIEYRASLVSDFDLVASCFGERSFYCCFRVHGIRLVKNFIPLQVSPVRKRLRAFKSKRVMVLSMTKGHLLLTSPSLFTSCFKQKNEVS